MGACRLELIETYPEHDVAGHFTQESPGTGNCEANPEPPNKPHLFRATWIGAERQGEERRGDGGQLMGSNWAPEEEKPKRDIQRGGQFRGHPVQVQRSVDGSAVALGARSKRRASPTAGKRG